MRLKDINEFDLIRKLTAGAKGNKALIKGIGDDTAVIAYKKNNYLLFTTDIIIEGVHFDLKKAKAGQIGHKALASNISDIAAMGGSPAYAVVSLGLPGKLRLDFAKSLYNGIKKTANCFSVKIVGGDVSASEKLIINIALLGFAKKKNLTLRSGARAGDRIFVTGRLGGSGRKKHLTFKPRVKEALLLTSGYKINAMIDLSDGLISDLRHIVNESAAGACLYRKKIPLSKEASGEESALYEGEDFELLFTLNEKEAGRLKERGLKGSRLKLTEIGRVTEKDRGLTIVDEDGKEKKLSFGKGFRHFK
ncbi:MAG: thiamine-monophosphate kinase [Candidatus Omnitrophica bacterium]|nr:thiamine-monophosphate kinase [Candidatus Omnitrophota bacterium]